VNGWLIGATVLVVSLLPLGWTAFRAEPLEGLVALELAGVVVTAAFVCLAQGFERTTYIDLALVLAPLQFVGALVFVRLLERGL
jgi:multisubunit Na+/H+ antiporter MnhF subunit